MTPTPITTDEHLAHHLMAMTTMLYVALMEDDDDAVEVMMKTLKRFYEANDLAKLVETTRRGLARVRAERN